MVIAGYITMFSVGTLVAPQALKEIILYAEMCHMPSPTPAIKPSLLQPCPREAIDIYNQRWYQINEEGRWASNSVAPHIANSSSQSYCFLYASQY